MWMNETLPIMWASMPPEFHQALSTLLPQAFNGILISEGNALPLIGGTPVYAASTVVQTTTEYTYKRCPSCGENHIPVAGKPKKNTIRLELRLNNRNTDRLADTVFEAPKDYEKESVEPILESREVWPGVPSSVNSGWVMPLSASDIFCASYLGGTAGMSRK